MDGHKSSSAAMTISIILNLVLVIALAVLFNAYTQLQQKYDKMNSPQPQSSAVDIGGYEETESDFIPGGLFEPEVADEQQQVYNTEVEPAGTKATEATAQTTAEVRTTTSAAPETAATTEAKTTVTTVPTAISVDEDEDSGEWLDIWGDD